MTLILKPRDERPELIEGRKLVEEDFGSKGATDFEWNGGSFRARTYVLHFGWEGARYRIEIGHKSLTDLKNDDQREARLAAFWEGKSKLDSVNG